MTQSVRIVRHAGITVENLDRMLDFYCGVLGFSIKVRANEGGPFIDRMLGEKGVVVTTAKLAPPEGGAMIELLEFASPASGQRREIAVTTPGPTHVALTVGDLRALKPKLEAAGAAFLGEPGVSPDGKVLAAYCRDPEGNFLELVEEL